MDSLKLSILKRLYFSNPQSIAELSTSIGKSVPNITNAVNKLLQLNLIEQDGLAPSTGGRRAAQFVPNEKHLPLILSIAIDQFYTSVVVVDFKNQYKTAINTEVIDLREDDAYEKIIALTKTTIQQTDAYQIYGIGVTIPGFVDSKTGKNNSYSSNSPFYDLKTNIQKEFNLPTFVENDSSAIAIAEHKFGSAKSIQDVMVVNLNWGVGLGMILDNELYRGHSGFAGEFSHIPLSDSNKLCSCGKKGCLEVDASLLAAVESATNSLKSGEVSSLQSIFKQQKYLTGDQLLSAAIQGDQLAMEAVNKIGYMLGKGIATLIHIINPELVLISGRGAKAKDVLLPKIQSAVLEFSIKRLSQNTKIQFSNTENIQLLGSTCICILSADKNIYKTQLID
ncbi:Making large colonies protein [Sphingobacterium mizutaii]|uniref:Making large colonies protein n=1 Tax=Sphingobacterium mizutaii TaxID=1010 RepID=A0AAJ4X8S7_9SPHI|nr:ROK family transcriptional regulator [Sphingobacterium mizutaii]SDL71692.1 Sugar kinase of the NBD/HSP70 family, may contain an N-terminal HTH domain [Sphingobacterium mizutaii]SNV41480.1 Making large colonies protein [Sphingobacterium mizutaii]